MIDVIHGYILIGSSDNLFDLLIRGKRMLFMVSPLGGRSFDMKRKVASDDLTSGNRAIAEEMSANPRLGGQVDLMLDD